MIIHVVQPGETIYSIADTYGKPADRLIQENELDNPNNLAVGQNIIIVYPKETYTVKEGDTLESIADAFGVTPMQLLRNNPYLSDREFLNPGETIVISYEDNKIMTISTNGYAYPFININTLKKSLPFLTYLTIFKYNVTAEGELNDIDDIDAVQTAKEYGVAPIMLVSTLTDAGTADINVTQNILNNEEIQNRLIENILIKLEEKGYYGLNLDSQFIPSEYRELYVDFAAKVTNRLNTEGYAVLITIAPSTFELETGVFYEGIDYAGLGQVTNSTMLLSYAWGYSYELPMSTMPFALYRNLLDYAVTQIPPEKISIGITSIGYVWRLPRMEGVSRASSISHTNALNLAGQVGATIQYDEASEASFFYSGDNNENIVWFKDSESMNNALKLVPEYGLQGIGIWNIMYFLSRLFLLLNVQYDIEKVI